MEKINRRKALSKIGKFALAAAAGPALAGTASAGPRKNRRPNIILILADDLGYNDLGCYGSKSIKTPNLDKLASEGLRFAQYYVATPLCAPTRVSIMTGKNSLRTSLSWNPDRNNPEDGLSPDETTIAEVLKNAGYVTGLVGKWHLGYAPKFRPLRQGFDEYFGSLSGWTDYYEHTYHGKKWMFRNDNEEDREGYLTRIFTEEAVAFIDRHRDEPFFLYLAYNAPHSPDQAPEKYRKRNETLYGAMIDCLDEHIGRLLDHLKARGLEKDTLVIFLSDNGGDGRIANKPLRGQKGQLWEGGIRVPAIFRWPGRIKPGTVTNEPVISMDIFATIADAASAKLPAELNVDGKSALPILPGKGKSLHEELCWVFHDQSAIRRGGWKLVEIDGKTGLYDLDSDVGETTDLSAQKPELVKDLSARLAAWKEDIKRSKAHANTP